MREIWKDVKGYEKLYQISNMGRVRSMNYRRKNVIGILNPGRDKDGYLQVNLSKKGKTRMSKIHRLVAEAFILKEKNKNQVNHKDGNKENNHIENLEWCTNSENLVHSHYVLKNTHGKKARHVLCIETNKAFLTISEAARATGARQPHISQCLKGKRHQSGGYHWRELNEQEFRNALC